MIVVLIGALSVGAARLTKVSKADLGVGAESTENCKAPVVRSFWKMYGSYPDYNGEDVANYFASYAAYASNAYTPEEAEAFTLPEHHFGWGQHGSNIVKLGGFLAQVYYRETSDRLLVMTVYRGTDGLFSVSDNISNASWFTQMINPWDQYRTARETFREIRAEATRVAAGRSIGFLTVGHSLGGGLARHVAKAFPCTSAIVFNSSFVTNEFRLAEPYDDAQVVDLFEEKDPLSWASLYAKPDEFFKNRANHQWYRLYNVGSADSQHGIYLAARAMARIPAKCLKERRCGNLAANGQRPIGELPYPLGRENVLRLWCESTNLKSASDLCDAPNGIVDTSSGTNALQLQ